MQINTTINPVKLSMGPIMGGRNENMARTRVMMVQVAFGLALIDLASFCSSQWMALSLDIGS